MNETLRKLQQANPKLNMRSVADPSFERYGRLLTQYDPTEIIARAKPLIPAIERVAYEPSVAALEAPCAFNTAMANEVYGGMPMQVGWCYGKNVSMAGLEYHKGSEVDVCITDAVLLVGHVQDIVFGDQITYDTTKVAAFYAPAGSVVELSPWNMHFAPISASEGEQFDVLVYLPKFTNERITFQFPRVGENRLLFAVNKWLIVHPDAKGLVDHGAYPGMVGDDIVVQYK